MPSREESFILFFEVPQQLEIHHPTALDGHPKESTEIRWERNTAQI